MNLSELEYDSDYDNINNEEKNIFSNFLNSQHQMKRLTLLMVDADFWNPIMKMTNLEYLDLNIAYESSNELLIHNLDCHQKNKSLKFLRIQFELGDNDLKLCQSFVDFFPGLITFELR